MGLADSALRKKVNDLAGRTSARSGTSGSPSASSQATSRWSSGMGRSPRRQRTPDGHAVFEIGSVTKVFTAALLAEMAGRGEVALDQPVAELLPPGVRMPSRPVSRSRWPTSPSTPRPCRGCRATCGPP